MGLLKKDLIAVFEKFPKLEYFESETPKVNFLRGQLDICDTIGEYRGSFKVLITVPETYPYCIPLVLELSTLIPREIDRHISPHGICCLDIDHELQALAKNGIRLADFITNKVYTFFANQLFYEENGGFAGKEYAHFFKGVQQFYSERLALHDPQTCVQVLNKVIANKLPGRNEMCVCGNKRKYKDCHIGEIGFLRNLGKDQLQKDLEGFRNIILADKEERIGEL